MRTNFATAGVRGRCTPSRYASVIAGTWISAPSRCTVAAAPPTWSGCPWVAVTIRTVPDSGRGRCAAGFGASKGALPLTNASRRPCALRVQR